MAARRPRTNHVRGSAMNKGKLPDSDLRRTWAFLTEDVYTKIADRADALGVSPSVISAEIINAWAAQEPPPIFLGVDEHS
jgi:hypothetical protein